MPRRYDLEFKLEAVRMVSEPGMTAKGVEQRFGIGKGVLSRIYDGSKGRYGSPKITRELRDRGCQVSKSRVARRMRAAGLRSKVRRKYRVTTDSKHQFPVAPNLLERNFTTNAPDKAWVSDITYLATRTGWLYLTVIIDLFSRVVVGWPLSSSVEP